MHILRKRPWHLPESALTDEQTWLDRRQIVKGLGLGTLLAGSGVLGASALAGTPDGTPPAGPIPKAYAYHLPPVKRNPAYPLDRPITEEEVAASYNNFYEFTTDKAKVWTMAASLQVKPWSIEVSGACQKPTTFSMEDILKKMPLEERTYRFRCVEAWSMAVPWTGFPVKALLQAVKPLSSARYVRLVTRDAPAMFPGVTSQKWYPWPYHEGLTMKEAMNDLAIFAVGIYGHALPNQHGAPFRLITPWKYGYKNIKSIVKIELVQDEPKTFWHEVVPDEYDFWGNVRPDKPHPRWSQATERVIPTGERVPTLMYNGYAEQVAGLYPG